MHKQSLFHISKREALPLHKALLIRGGIILLALVFCGLVTTVLTGQNPLSVYATILDGAFGSGRRIGVTFRNTAITQQCCAESHQHCHHQQYQSQEALQEAGHLTVDDRLHCISAQFSCQRMEGKARFQHFFGPAAAHLQQDRTDAVKQQHGSGTEMGAHAEGYQTGCQKQQRPSGISSCFHFPQYRSYHVQARQEKA